MSNNCQWHMPSNNGRKSASFEALTLHRAMQQIEFRVDLVGRCHPLINSGTGSLIDNELVDDFKIQLPSVLIPQVSCTNLIKAFENWLRSNTPFIVPLCSTADYTMTVQVELREDLITTTDRPAFTLNYNSIGCRLENYFVIDQSCIRLARQELEHVLNSLGVGDNSMESD